MHLYFGCKDISFFGIPNFIFAKMYGIPKFKNKILYKIPYLTILCTSSKKWTRKETRHGASLQRIFATVLRLFYIIRQSHVNAGAFLLGGGVEGAAPGVVFFGRVGLRDLEHAHVGTLEVA